MVSVEAWGGGVQRKYSATEDPGILFPWGGGDASTFSEAGARSGPGRGAEQEPCLHRLGWGKSEMLLGHEKW